MQFTPTPNSGSQLDRALRWYFVQTVAGCTANNTYTADSLSVKGYPAIVVASTQSSHNPEQTGNEVWDVVVTVKYSVAQGPNTPNPYAARVNRDALVGGIMAAMMQASNDIDGNVPLDATASNITMYGRAYATAGSAQEQQNNSDMDEFTCLSVYFKGSSRGNPDEDGCDWVEVRHFKIEACPAALN